MEGPGEEEIWKELMCHTNAERDTNTTNRNVNVIWTQKVLERIDEEQSNMALKTKKQSSKTKLLVPTVRAQKEPIGSIICHEKSIEYSIGHSSSSTHCHSYFFQ